MSNFVEYDKQTGEIIRMFSIPEWDDPDRFIAEGRDKIFTEIADLANDRVILNGPENKPVIERRPRPPAPTPTPPPTPNPPGPPGVMPHQNSYQARRAAAYPSIEQQLEWIWQAMDDGRLPKIEPMYSTIQAVKDAIPKEADGKDIGPSEAL